MIGSANRFRTLTLRVNSQVFETLRQRIFSPISQRYPFLPGTESGPSNITVLALLNKLNDRDRKIAGTAILTLSVCCTAGIYTGVLIDEYWLLSPTKVRSSTLAGPKATTAQKDSKENAEKKPDAASSTPPDSGHHYIRSGETTSANEIDRLKGKSITTEDAYERMYRLAISYEQQLQGGQK